MSNFKLVPPPHENDIFHTDYSWHHFDVYLNLYQNTPPLLPGERERLRDDVMKFPIFIIMIIL